MSDEEKRLNKYIDAYIEKFGYGLPVDFSTRLPGEKDEIDEAIEAITKAIENNQPFEDEGVFFEDEI